MSGETVDFLGETFTIADKISSLAFARFAKVAKAGTDANDLDGLAAMYDMVEQCLAPSDWARFEKHADKERADGDQLLQFVQGVFAVMAERPTGRSSDSSGGPRIIEPRSTVDSSVPDLSDRVIGRFNDQGRPDLALVVRRRQESLTA